MFIDEEGKPIRYRSLYTTGYSEPWKFPARHRRVAGHQPVPNNKRQRFLRPAHP